RRAVVVVDLGLLALQRARGGLALGLRRLGGRLPLPLLGRPLGVGLRVLALLLGDEIAGTGKARQQLRDLVRGHGTLPPMMPRAMGSLGAARSEEHTSELQSRENLVC